MRIPIDTAGLTFIAGNDPSMVLDMEGKPRADRATGEVLWGLDLVALGSEDGAEVWAVRVAGEPKGVQVGQPLNVEGLVAMPWEIDGRHGISFRARKLAAMGGSQAKATAAAA
ncbi:MAG: hypothetical protein Q8O56_15210 [Solirubrobacteraceae bacterium]|nr:hypothetical protein [Solirubrobacteraceae bacterium]